MREVYIVQGGGVLLAAYDGPRGALYARLHAKSVLGASVVSLPISSTLPDNVREDLAADMEWQDDDGDTPVVEAVHGDEEA